MVSKEFLIPNKCRRFGTYLVVVQFPESVPWKNQFQFAQFVREYRSGMVFGLRHCLDFGVGDRKKNQAKHFGYTVCFLCIYWIGFVLGIGALNYLCGLPILTFAFKTESNHDASS